MSASTQFMVLGASSVNVDGKVYSSIYLGQNAEEGSDSSKGVEIMKVGCDAEVFHSLPKQGYPLDCAVELQFKKAAGGKMGQHCVKATPVRAAAKA